MVLLRRSGLSGDWPPDAGLLAGASLDHLSQSGVHTLGHRSVHYLGHGGSRLEEVDAVVTLDRRHQNGFHVDAVGGKRSECRRHFQNGNFLGPQGKRMERLEVGPDAGRLGQPFHPLRSHRLHETGVDDVHREDCCLQEGEVGEGGPVVVLDEPRLRVGRNDHFAAPFEDVVETEAGFERGCQDERLER